MAFSEFQILAAIPHQGTEILSRSREAAGLVILVDIGKLPAT